VDELFLEVVRRDGLVADLARSRSMVRGAPAASRRARWLASSTSSNRFSTLSMQSSTVTRAMADGSFLEQGVGN
jgi:hypothetical protein